jgi:hypothetical protein
MLLGMRRFALLPAIAKQESTSHIFAALEDLEVIACCLEILFDLRIVSDGLFGEMAQRLEEIRRQLYGLKKKYGHLT